jgi:Tfp pilus assembly protein PilO
MTPAWSRQLAQVMNTRHMLQQPMELRAAFVRAAKDVNSAKELSDKWQDVLRTALASGSAL